MNTTLYFITQDDWQMPVSVIPATSIVTQKIGDSVGYVFPAADRDQVIVSLGWSPSQVMEIPTSSWGVDQLILRSNGASAPDVQVVYHNDALPEWREYLNEVAAWFAQRPLPLPVRIHYAWEQHQLYANGHFHVCFGGEAPFGIQTWLHDRAVRYQRNHVWIGELGPEHGHCRQLISPLLEVFVPCARGQQGEYQCESLVATCTRHINHHYGQLEEHIAKCEETIQGLQKKLVEEIRRQQRLQAQYVGLSPLGDGQRARSQETYTQILGRDFVRALTCVDPVISVFTDRVLIKISGHGKYDGLYDIGEFRIDINTNGGDGCVKLFNLSRQVTGFSGKQCHHPHVTDSGVPCLGTIKEVIPRYIAQAEYVAVVDLMWQYLQNTAPGDAAGQHIVNWPRFSSTHL